MKKFMLFILGLLTVSPAIALHTDYPSMPRLNVDEKAALYQIIDLINNHQTEALQNLFNTQNDTINLRNVLINAHLGLTPLHYALLKGSPNPEIVSMLLKAGSQPNQPLQQLINYEGERTLTLYSGWTALHIAIQCYCSEEILELLMDAQGDFFQADNGGWRPLDLVFHATSIPAANFVVKTMGYKNELSNIQFKRAREHSHYLTFLNAHFRFQFIYHPHKDYFTLSRNNKRQH